VNELPDWLNLAIGGGVAVAAGVAFAVLFGALWARR
jgi:hypothetical protein